jgi:hypothetical protein
MCHSWAFRSCGEVEVFDGGFVVAGEVVLVAVTLLVVAHIGVEMCPFRGGLLPAVLGSCKQVAGGERREPGLSGQGGADLWVPKTVPSASELGFP